MAAAHLVASPGRSTLIDARAEVGEQARAIRAGEDAREVEHDEAVEHGSGRVTGAV